MELPKKICSLGILDINLNFELTQKESIKYNFNFNKCNSVDYLQTFFDQKSNLKNNQNYSNILDHISLTSDNNLINTLLFINRAYKNKSFIEFIMPNKIKFTNNQDNIFNVIKYILGRNYFFIIENKINDFPISIKFLIKIYSDDSSKEIIYSKEFQLFEKIDMNNYNENDLSLSSINKNNILSEINYNFSADDYFILDLDLFNNPVWNIENCNNDDNSLNYNNNNNNLVSF